LLNPCQLIYTGEIMHKVTVKYKVSDGLLDVVVISEGQPRMYKSIIHATKDLEEERIVSIKCVMYEKD